MLGRPNCCEPVFIRIWPGAWLNASVAIDLTMAMSSTTVARCGSSSESSAPHLPCLANLNFGPSSFEFGIDERGAIALEQLGRRQRAVELGELRLVVEQLQVAGRAGHEQVDDALGLRRVVRLLRRERIQGGILQSGCEPRVCNKCPNAMAPSPTPHCSMNQRRLTCFGSWFR